jgi:hypothetical protein
MPLMVGMPAGLLAGAGASGVLLAGSGWTECDPELDEATSRSGFTFSMVCRTTSVPTATFDGTGEMRSLDSVAAVAASSGGEPDF